MMPDEKSRLLTLLAHHENWCRGTEALDAHGEPVTYDDVAAVAWDLTGALCLLFGWPRACVLFRQMEKHVMGRRKTFGWPLPDPSLHAMKSLQEFNDRADTTFAMLRERIEGMSVWTSGRRDAGPAPE